MGFRLGDLGSVQQETGFLVFLAMDLQMVRGQAVDVRAELYASLRALFVRLHFRRLIRSWGRDFNFGYVSAPFTLSTEGHG